LSSAVFEHKQRQRFEFAGAISDQKTGWVGVWVLDEKLCSEYAEPQARSGTGKRRL
jgi:hypothetical protein